MIKITFEAENTEKLYDLIGDYLLWREHLSDQLVGDVQTEQVMINRGWPPKPTEENESIKEPDYASLIKNAAKQVLDKKGKEALRTILGLEIKTVSELIEKHKYDADSSFLYVVFCELVECLGDEYVSPR